ncbi:YjfB family protein [Massilia sp. TS11]|uniref:YjfB family protein n=1 Tax=Massilia sp. TS11 TaxID=2908003 RepID=UPI001EDACFE1|nr:YjfB family protein [Massilia sp. TS11]MCG2585650.1 YjfB family protein [Massilia sp. TS11]
MDVSGIAKFASTVADTGTKREVDFAVLRKAQEVETSTATQLIDALKAVPTPNLPPHLGSKINTTA